MKGNFLQCTHNGTGGTGDLTLATVDAFLTLGAPLGANIRQIYYKIVEYDGDPSTGRRNFVRSESGWCPLDNTGGSPVLKRSDGTIVVLTSNDGTNSYPRAGSSTAPSKQSFGNTAANIRISYSAGIEDNPFSCPVITATSGVTTSTGMGPIGGANGQAIAIQATLLGGNGITSYIPFAWGQTGLYTQCSMAITAATAGTASATSLNVAIYEVSKNGDPGKKLADFGSLGVLTSTAVLTSSALGTAVELDPGWYYLAVLPIWTGSLTACSLQAYVPTCGGPLGTILATAAGSYAWSNTAGSQTTLNDPATAPNTKAASGASFAPLFGLK